MMKTRAEIEAMRDSILAMKPGDQLRLAAELIDRGHASHAEPIVKNVADVLTALRLFGKRPA